MKLLPTMKRNDVIQLEDKAVEMKPNVDIRTGLLAIKNIDKNPFLDSTTPESMNDNELNVYRITDGRIK
ncbi:hypothetical protein DICVIV_08873 [Dictyocaulus viviparus]|uniref:Uncharacterized protein n=1 Tax=Dictyocaulus viviparus TaxID=29172 RepID=A0A0D8XKE0_DICVI|nr:hypothetical protein DICVIV_08873 [Dictyocaulus viviparus]